MSKVFMVDGIRHAAWRPAGSSSEFDYYCDVNTEDIPAFIAWLQEGPPKKEWIITKRFARKPQGQVFDNAWHPLTDADVERVTS